MLDFMNSEANLEVLITQKGSRFKAVCSSFPDCKGFGDTKEEALERLSKSISTFIGKISHSMFKNLLSSQKYSSVFSSKDAPNIDHRIFKLRAPEKPSTNKDIFCKLPPIESPLSAPEPQFGQDIRQLFQEPSLPTFNDMTDILPTEEDDLLFGISLSLN